MGNQPQQFLKSEKARNLTALGVMRMSERKVRELVEELRWDNREPVCPHCNRSGAWRITAKQTLKSGKIVPRRLFKCKHKECRKQFSLTSGTSLNSLKKPLKERLLTIFQFSRGAKGYAALSQCYQTPLTYKSAFVCEHKLRQALTGVTHLARDEFLRGDVEADIIFVGGYKRPARHSAYRVDRRLKEFQTGKRQGILVIRERGDKGRIVTFVVKNESQARDYIFLSVQSGARLFLDAATGWSGLDTHYDVKSVDHSTTYARWEGGLAINTNQAESYNSRLRRAEIGIHHRVAGRYSGAYAREMAWREVNRRQTARDLFRAIVAAALKHEPCRTWLGYWAERAPDAVAR